MQNQLHNHFVNVNHAVVSVRRRAFCSPICTKQRYVASGALLAALHHFLSPSPSWVNDSEADPVLTGVSSILFAVFSERWIRLWCLPQHPILTAGVVILEFHLWCWRGKLKLTEKISHQRKSNNFAKLQLASIKWDSHHLSLVKIKCKLVI